MAVKVGSARIDENGNAHGGKAGDQNGKEVSTQNYYVHKKGWRVFRAKNATKAKMIAECMQAACDNPYIGYDQYQRLTLYNEAKPANFSASKVKTKVETDCSALVRVCLAYAGIAVANFRTTNQAKVLLASGEFIELTGDKYTKDSSYLKAGDILVTKTQGHTVVVLSNGSKAATDKVTTTNTSTTTTVTSNALRKGDKGEEVKKMQQQLANLGYDLGMKGVDGSFGPATLKAVKQFQKDNALEVDGICGPLTKAALSKKSGKTVVIRGGNCHIRTGPAKTYKSIGIAKNGTAYTYAGETSGNWHKIVHKNQNGWVSGKYGKVEG